MHMALLGRLPGSPMTLHDGCGRMSGRWITLSFLAIMLCACSEREPPRGAEFDPVTAADPVMATDEPDATSTPATPTPPAVDPIAARAKQASDYFQAASQRADERLQTAEQDCRTLELNSRDDCSANATAVHESELAAARVEYAAQQAQGEGN